MNVNQLLQSLYQQYGDSFFFVKAHNFPIEGLDDPNFSEYELLLETGHIKRVGTSYSKRYGHREMFKLTEKGLSKVNEQ